MRTLTAKFKPANGYTTDFIKDQILPKLNSRLPIVEDAKQDELIQAVSAFFAHGLHNFVVDYSSNPLFEEITTKLVNYGWLRPDDTVKNVYRQSLPNNRLAFISLYYDSSKPKVDTVYGTRYVDGSHDEVDQKDITFVDGYPVEVWNRQYANK